MNEDTAPRAVGMQAGDDGGIVKAVLNMLDDLNEEKVQLQDAQKAVLNILTDAAEEGAQLQMTQRAVLNVLDDAAEERAQLEDTQKAVLNILADSNDEKQHMVHVQRAMANILEDFDADRRGLDEGQRALLNILEDLDAERLAAAEANRALKGANAELESFSYSVSHDLRVPLRAVDGFSRILEEDYGNKLDEEGRKVIETVRAGTKRMGQLIDDILAFSRMGRKEMSAEALDMEAIVRSIAEELAPARAGRDVRLEIGPLPAAGGDAAMIRQVWVNLLGNAVKFTRPRLTAEIEVSGSVTAEESVYCVRDNGVGFDMEYAHKLFGVFQRLHAVSEFEGTGIGLAIVKRIIARHRGRVWAEGRPDKGATFWFALPRA